MPEDPNWPRADAWPRPPGRGTADLVILGAPVRLGSISGGRFDLAPGAVRRALARFATWDGGRDLRDLKADEAGDLDVAERTPAEAFDPIRIAVADWSSTLGGALVVLGGDNSVTNPAVRGLADHAGLDLEKVGLVTLDAHHDLRDTADGLNNGNPVRALLEAGMPGANVVQIGIQAFANSASYSGVAEEAGIRVTSADEVRARGAEAVVEQALTELAGRTEAIHVDLDVDVLDRTFAPACPGARPGGLMPWELHRAAFLAGRHPQVACVDIVEVDPERDVDDITVMNAARCLLSFASGLARRLS